MTLTVPDSTGQTASATRTVTVPPALPAARTTPAPGATPDRTPPGLRIRLRKRRRLRVTAWRLGLAAVLAVLLLGTADARALSFGPAELMPGSASAASADVATDGAGNATAVVLRPDEVAIAERPAGGAWGEPQPIATGFRQGFDPRGQPFIEMNASGAALVLWRGDCGGLCAVTRAATGAPWSPVQRLFERDLPFARGAVGENGDMAVAFTLEEEDLAGPDDFDVARGIFKPANRNWQSARSFYSVDWNTSELRMYDVGFEGGSPWVLFADVGYGKEGLLAAFYDSGGYWRGRSRSVRRRASTAAPTSPARHRRWPDTRGRGGSSPCPTAACWPSGRRSTATTAGSSTRSSTRAGTGTRRWTTARRSAVPSRTLAAPGRTSSPTSRST